MYQQVQESAVRIPEFSDKAELKYALHCMREGDWKALEWVYREYGGLFYTIARRYSASSMEAEDLVQESFVQIYRKVHSFKGVGSFEGWMKRVVVNTCLMSLRKNRLRFDDSDGRNLLDMEIPVSNHILSALEAEDIVSAMQELPGGCRAVLNLHAIEGMDHKEIAEALHISESASRSQLTKARKRLKVVLIERKLI